MRIANWLTTNNVNGVHDYQQASTKEMDRAFLLVPAQVIVGEFLKTFEQFPPRQKPASFSIDQALEKAQEHQKAMAKTAGGG